MTRARPRNGIQQAWFSGQTSLSEELRGMQDDLLVAIRYIDKKKGQGVFVKESVPAGTLLFAEEPFTSRIAFLENSMDGMLC